MQYLVHVSHDAENLQFWLWIQDYIKRFFAIPRSEQALSPPWNPDDVAQASAKSHEHLPKPLGKSKLSMTEFVVSLDSLGDMKPSTIVTPFDMESFVSERTSSSRTVSESVSEAYAEAGLTWHACKLILGHEMGCHTHNRLDSYYPTVQVRNRPYNQPLSGPQRSQRIESHSS